MVKVRKSDYKAQDLYKGFCHRGSSQMNQLKSILNAVGNVREQILKTDEDNWLFHSNTDFALLNTNFRAQFLHLLPLESIDGKISRQREERYPDIEPEESNALVLCDGNSEPFISQCMMKLLNGNH